MTLFNFSLRAKSNDMLKFIYTLSIGLLILFKMNAFLQKLQCMHLKLEYVLKVACAIECENTLYKSFKVRFLSGPGLSYGNYLRAIVCKD